MERSDAMFGWGLEEGLITIGAFILYFYPFYILYKMIHEMRRIRESIDLLREVMEERQ